jgi:hypothetical protein
MRKKNSNREQVPYGSRFKKELKRVAYTTGGSTPISTIFSTTLNQYLLNTLAVGPDAYQRVGKVVCLRTLKIRGFLLPTGNGAINDYVRVLVVYDRQANSTPVFGSYVAGQDYLGNSSQTAFDDYNVDYEDRFIVLKDVKFGLPQLTGAASYVSTNLTNYKSMTNIDWTINLRNLEAHYAAGTNLPVTGALYLVMLGSNPVATSPVAIQWNATLSYTD